MGDQPAPFKGSLCGMGCWGTIAEVAAPGRRRVSSGGPETGGQQHIRPHRMSSARILPGQKLPAIPQQIQPVNQHKKRKHMDIAVKQIIKLLEFLEFRIF